MLKTGSPIHKGFPFFYLFKDEINQNQPELGNINTGSLYLTNFGFFR